MQQMNKGKKCSLCEKKASIFKPESGELLCKTHFLLGVERNVNQTITKNKMLKREDKIAIAFSGGKDSVALLYILNKIEKKFPETELLPFYVKEGIKSYQEEAYEIVKLHTEKMDLDLQVFSFDEFYGITLDKIISRSKKLPKNKQVSPCTYCGILRRKSFELAAKEMNANVIATGHNNEFLTWGFTAF